MSLSCYQMPLPAVTRTVSPLVIRPVSDNAIEAVKPEVKRPRSSGLALC